MWAKTFREWMKTSQPQFKEAGNERCVYVFREQGDGTPTDLDNLRGIQLAPDERIIILVMNTDDMLIAYSENARSLVDDFEHDHVPRSLARSLARSRARARALAFSLPLSFEVPAHGRLCLFIAMPVPLQVFAFKFMSACRFCLRPASGRGCACGWRQCRIM